MKKAGHWFLSFVSRLLLLLLVIVLLPYCFRLAESVFPDLTGNIESQSAVLMRELQSSSRLETTIVDEEGVIDSKTSVILLGTVGTTTVHYRYHASIGIDLSRVQMKISGKNITFLLPELEVLNDSIEMLKVQKNDFLSHAIDKDVNLLLSEQREKSRAYYLDQNEHSEKAWEDTRKAFENTIAQWITRVGGEKYTITYERLAGENKE